MFVEQWPTETIVRLQWSKTLRGYLSPWMIVETCRGDDAQSSTDDEGSSSKQHSPERTKTTRNCRRKARRSDETSDNDFFFTMQYNLLITKSALRNVLRTGKRVWEQRVPLAQSLGYESPFSSIKNCSLNSPKWQS